uniref:Glycerate kinase n=2 Tax=Palpitomonas bilix TaxID=652834 RepID=A0A7S3D4B4_9EUKA|mmetsp:Transcript_21355/g.55503  ORF Transcript_21355/g.55503 Transcript_21355/m.55503 type:complete len:489 (+) Transcript_21355:259-1725(+)
MSDSHSLANAIDVCNVAINSCSSEAAVSGKFLVQEITHDSCKLCWDGKYEETTTDIVLIGVGKASVEFLSAIMKRLVEKNCRHLVRGGIAVTKFGSNQDLKQKDARSLLSENGITCIESTHPEISNQSHDSVVAIKHALGDASKRLEGDKPVFLVVVTGGTSALCCDPADGVSIEDMTQLNRMLLESGADIHRINKVRRSLDRFKGGGLLRLCYSFCPEAVLWSLLVSDVIGDVHNSIGSGSGSYSPISEKVIKMDARHVLDSLFKRASLPPNVAQFFSGDSLRVQDDEASVVKRALDSGRLMETVIVSNRIGLEAAKNQGSKLGYNTYILSSTLRGEAEEVGKMYSSLAESTLVRSSSFVPPCMIICGGETTVTMQENPGKGGRNQHLVLSFAINAHVGPFLSDCGSSSVLLVSCGTDGTDGPTDAAGAYAFFDSLKDESVFLQATGALRAFDSYQYFSLSNPRQSGLVHTGQTGTNVMDVQVLVIS